MNSAQLRKTPIWKANKSTNTKSSSPTPKIAPDTIDDYLETNPERFAKKLKRKNGKQAVRAEIATILKAQKARELRKEFFKELTASADVKYLDDRVKPEATKQQD